jgi:PBP1b-binding outer membrane lipoprotein LpoB
MKILITFTIITTLLMGCGKEEHNTVQYYIENPDARNNKISECDNGAIDRSSPSCVNARTAKAKAFMKKNLGVGEHWGKGE